MSSPERSSKKNEKSKSPPKADEKKSGDKSMEELEREQKEAEMVA